MQVYSSSRAFVPSALHSSVRVVENKVSELGSPLLTAVQTRSEQVLTSLDRKVRLLPQHASHAPAALACPNMPRLDPQSAQVMLKGLIAA